MCFEKTVSTHMDKSHVQEFKDDRGNWFGPWLPYSISYKSAYN